MSKWVVPISAGLLVPTLFAAAWAAGAPQTSSQAREAQSVIKVCATCHDMQIVMDTPRSYDAWHDSVQKMVDLGAKGTDQQYDDIMDFLHRTMTTIDVNSADPDELEIVLSVSETTAQAIVARRRTKKFTGLADLKSIPGVDATTVDSKARLIFFN
ncbi:MAG TPA: helix-hairpin-helix domain-containing protein [Acidobacteriaceae bacterium]|jgi:competence protein ComEA|nr:helix-hairpin-helix domain-containing protein [Acidobacteriaceae bacterium]